MRVLVTGVPGCGKTVFSRKLARFLNAKTIVVNEIVSSKKIFSKSKSGEKLVDVKKLEKALKRLIAGGDKGENVIADSHLLCEMRLPCDRIIVLRCNPLVLKKRLEKRGYAGWKVRENVVAELLDYCSIKTSENYAASKILEVDFTKPLSPKRVWAKRKSDKVDWMRGFGVLERKVKGFFGSGGKSD